MILSVTSHGQAVQFSRSSITLQCLKKQTLDCRNPPSFFPSKHINTVFLLSDQQILNFLPASTISRNKMEKFTTLYRSGDFLESLYQLVLSFLFQSFFPIFPNCLHYAKSLCKAIIAGECVYLMMTAADRNFKV